MMAGHTMPTSNGTTLAGLDSLLAVMRAQILAEIGPMIQAECARCMAEMASESMMAMVAQIAESIAKVTVMAPTVNVDVPEGPEPAITVTPAPVTVQRAIRQRIVYDDQGRISHLEPM